MVTNFHGHPGRYIKMFSSRQKGFLDKAVFSYFCLLSKISNSSQSFFHSKIVSKCCFLHHVGSRWWFQIFYIFTPTWNNDPIWLYNIFQIGLVQPPTRFDVLATWMSQKVSKWLGSVGYNLPINGVYWGYNPLTNHWSYLPEIPDPSIEFNALKTRVIYPMSRRRWRLVVFKVQDMQGALCVVVIRCWRCDWPMMVTGKIFGHDFSVCWCLMFVVDVVVVVVVVDDDDDDDDKIHNVGHHGGFFWSCWQIVALWGRKYDIPGGVLASSNWITLRSTNMPDWKITILNRRYIIPLQMVGFSIFLWIFRG